MSKALTALLVVLVMLQVLAFSGFPGARDPALLLSRPDERARLAAEIKPQGTENEWLRIPWTTSLSRARAQAAEVGKPLLIWSMGGSPLGST